MLQRTILENKKVTQRTGENITELIRDLYLEYSKTSSNSITIQQIFQSLEMAKGSE